MPSGIPFGVGTLMVLYLTFYLKAHSSINNLVLGGLEGAGVIVRKYLITEGKSLSHTDLIAVKINRIELESKVRTELNSG